MDAIGGLAKKTAWANHTHNKRTKYHAPISGQQPAQPIQPPEFFPLKWNNELDNLLHEIVAACTHGGTISWVHAMTTWNDRSEQKVDQSKPLKNR
jgi:hypothetical protein